MDVEPVHHDASRPSTGARATGVPYNQGGKWTTSNVWQQSAHLHNVQSHVHGTSCGRGSLGCKRDGEIGALAVAVCIPRSGTRAIAQTASPTCSHHDRELVKVPCSCAVCMDLAVVGIIGARLRNATYGLRMAGQQPWDWRHANDGMADLHVVVAVVREQHDGDGAPRPRATASTLDVSSPRTSALIARVWRCGSSKRRARGETASRTRRDGYMEWRSVSPHQSSSPRGCQIWEKPTWRAGREGSPHARDRRCRPSRYGRRPRWKGAHKARSAEAAGGCVRTEGYGGRWRGGGGEMRGR